MTDRLSTTETTQSRTLTKFSMNVADKSKKESQNTSRNEKSQLNLRAVIFSYNCSMMILHEYNKYLKNNINNKHSFRIRRRVSSDFIFTTVLCDRPSMFYCVCFFSYLILRAFIKWVSSNLCKTRTGTDFRSQCLCLVFVYMLYYFSCSTLYSE